MDAGLFLEMHMQMTPEIFTAVCAGVTLLIYFTASIIGMVVAIFRKIDKSREATIAYVDTKHAENNLRYEAMNTLVVQHECILNPEFPRPNGRHYRAR